MLEREGLRHQKMFLIAGGKLWSLRSCIILRTQGQMLLDTRYLISINKYHPNMAGINIQGHALIFSVGLSR